MEVTKATVAILAAACVAAGAAGGYLVTRETAPDPLAVAEAAPAPEAPYDAAQPVERSEGLIAEAPPVQPAPSPAGSSRPVPVQRPVAPAVASTPAPVTAAPPAPVPVEAVTPPAILPAPAPEPARPVEEPVRAVVEPALPEYHELVLSGDAVIGLQVETGISSETARVEDEVVARVVRDVRVGDHVAIPAGSKARGEVTLVEPGGKVRERARLGVRFTSIVLPDKTRVPIATETIYREGDAPGRESAAKIGGGALGGAILGGLLGGAKGAAIGGSIGAGAGSAAVLAGGRNPATLSPGSPVTIRLQQPVTVTVER